MTTQQQADAYRFFAIAFGAAPGVTYMNQIADAYAAGMTTKQIVNVYTTKPQFTSVYPTFYTNAQFANALIENVVGSSASAAAKTQAKADVEAALAAGWSRGDVIYQIFTNLANKPLTDADWGNTAKLLANQVAVAQYYTEVKLGNTEDLAVLKSVIAGVTPTTDVSTDAAKEAVLAAAGASNGQTFTLTDGADAFKGTAGNDTFVATEATLSSADIIDGGNGTDLFRYASSGTAAVNEAGFEIKNVETVQITSDAWFGTTFDFTGTQGVQTIRNFNSSVSQTLTGLKTLAPTIEIDSVGAQNRLFSIVDTTIVYDAAATKGTADAVQMNLSGNLNTDGSRVGTVTANGIEIFNVKSSGSASAFDGLASNTLREMNITGDANLTLAGASFFNTAAVNTVNAKDFTGNLNITLTNSGAPNIDVAVTGGKGNDRADFSAGFDKNDAFDGGEGTDTLALTNGVAVVVNPADFGTVKNVEILEITNGGTDVGASVLDLDNFPGVSTVYYSGLTSVNGLVGATTVQDVASGFTVKVNNPNGQNLTTTINTDGASDVLNLQVEKVATAGENLNVVTADKFETVNLSVTDDAADVGVGQFTINQLAINNATTLNIAGDAKLTIANDGNPTTPVLTTLNAKDQSGGITLTGVDFAKSGAAITFGSGDDTFNVATANGADTITLGAGKDRVVYTAVAQSNKNMDTITDFVSGTDVVDVRTLLGGIGIANSTQFVGNRPTFAQAQGALIGGLTQESAVFQQDEQILWVDVNKDGTLDNNDFRVKLSGVTSLTAADLGFGVGNTINLTAAGALVNLTTKNNADNFTTVEDDVINTKTAFLAGSNIDAKGGNDVMNITDDLAGANLGGVAVTSVEQVNLQQGASAPSAMFNGPTKIVSSAATTLTLGTGGQTYVGSAAVDTITDGAGNDTIQTGAGNDTIILNNASNDSVDAGDGNDTVNAGTFLTATDTLIGGAGNDTLSADDPAGGFAATDFDKVSGFETINLKINSGASVITTKDTLVAAGANLAVNIVAGATAALTFNGAAETDGKFTFTDGGSAQNHSLTGGAGNDVFNMVLNTGALTLNGGAGDDNFLLGATLKSTDTINGGAGFDNLWVTDGTAVTDLDGITNVERIEITNTLVSNYKPADSVIAAGQSITIDASGGNNSVNLDFSNETNGSFTYKASGFGDTITTAQNNLSDTIILGGGADKVTLTAGANTVANIANVDVIQNFKAGTDKIDVANAGAGTWSVTLASTSAATFVGDVNTALAALGLAYTGGAALGDAIIVTVNSGALAGTYVISDTTGPAFIDGTAEVVKLVGMTGTFTAADFV
jgi:hypothetical protein